jgi:hypothetical protein
MKPTYLERFAGNGIMGLEEQRQYMLAKVQRSKAGSSRFYPVFVPGAPGGAPVRSEEEFPE